MKIQGFDADGVMMAEQVYFSIGGGAVRTAETIGTPTESIYPRTTLEEIMQICSQKGITYWEYVLHHEGEEILAYLDEVWDHMKAGIKRGLATQASFPVPSACGGSHGIIINGPRPRPRLSVRPAHSRPTRSPPRKNAGGGTIVTAPTCGACGILPAILLHMQESNDMPDTDIVRALATAGVFGNILKHNASISGAEVGCQGEVGSACAMAAAAACQLLGGSLRQIEYAAEMGLEHHLGLTCDPVDGLVQIPCIERNASAATRAMSCAEMAILSDGSHYISFDEVASVMKQTGHDLLSPYRETSTGGLARVYADRS